MNRELFFNNEIETTILGTIFLDNTLIYELNEYDINIFYGTNNQRIFGVMKELNKTKTPIDLITVSEFIRRHELDIPLTLITDIGTSAATTRNFKSYKVKLLDYYEKREIDKLTRSIDYSEESEVIKNTILNKLNVLATNDIEEENTEDSVFNWFDNLDKEDDTRIKTTFVKLDNNFRGFGGGELITIAAYSGMGKTTLALDIMLRQAVKGIKTSLFSLEVPKTQVINKLMSNYSNVLYSKILNRELTEKEKDHIAISINKFPSKNINIYDKKSNLEYIVNQIRRDKLNKGIKIAYIDLINRVTTRERFPNRTNEIGYMTRTLKQLAMELDIAIVITAQINREGEKRIDGRPTISDIKESGSIVEDSDTVISLYRNRDMEKKQYRDNLAAANKLDYNSPNPDNNPERVEITILKARYSHGATFSMKWQPQLQRIQEVL